MKFYSNPYSRGDWMRELFMAQRDSDAVDALKYGLSAWESKQDQERQFNLALTAFDREMLQGMKVGL